MLQNNYSQALQRSRLRIFQQPAHLSFEIVGLPGDIRFMSIQPNSLRDFVEKQINGAYPDADISAVNDPSAKQKK